MGLKKIVNKINKEGLVVETFNSLRDASHVSNVSIHKMRRIIKSYKECGGFYFVYSGEFSNEKTDVISEYKCPYCGKNYKTYNGLSKHVLRYKIHGNKTKEELLTDFKYGGIRPVCECGCGSYTSIRFDGEPHFQKYVNGHNSKIAPNVLSEENRKTASERLKTLHREGRIRYWMTGMHIDDYTDEQLKAFTEKVWQNEERRKKMSSWLKTHPFSEEIRQKNIERLRTNEYRQFYSRLMHDRINSGKFSISSKFEEDFINEILSDYPNDNYIRQKFFPEIRQYCDFYFPEHKLIIECDGDFWHCNPEKYPDGPIFSYQEKRMEKDKIKDKYLIDNGFRIYRVWENDFKTKKEMVKKNIEKLLLE